MTVMGIQPSPRWPSMTSVGCCYTKNEPFQKVPLWFGKSLLRLEYFESANLTQSDRNARQPTMTWSAAPAPAGISRRGMNASRRRFWATFDGLSVMYSCLKIFCVILCLWMFILSCRYWYILPTYVRVYIYIYCIIYNISIVLLLIIIIIVIIITIIIIKIIIYIYVQLIMHAQLYNNYIVYTQIVDAKFRLLVLQKPKTAS